MSLTHDERETLQAAARIKRSLNRERRRNVLLQRPAEKKNRGRERDNGFLAFLRRQPCACGCGHPAPSDAAHIRMGNLALGKLPTGMQVKPSDRFAVPLNRDCHNTQHSMSEARFWSARGLDPFTIAADLFSAYQRGS